MSKIPFVLRTARRFKALIRPTAPVKNYVRVEFLNSAGATPDPVSRNALMGPVLQTALIPFVISR